MELAFRRFEWLVLLSTGLCEFKKARASLRDIAIADIKVNVFPRPMSSASMPPLGESGLANLLDPRIACS